MINNSFNLSAWTLRRPSLMIFAMLAVMIAGAVSYMRLSRNEDPPFTIKTMVVSAQWPGASTKDTVNLVTEKLERKLSEIPHLDFTQSYTRPGQSIIFVNLRDDTPPAKVSEIWYQVRKKSSDIAATLPEGVQGPSLNDEFGDTFGSIFAFEAEGFNRRELRDEVDKVRAELLSLANVGKVNVLGAEEEQVVIAFSSSKLAALGIDPSSAMDGIRAQNAVVPGGVVRTSQDVVSVRVSGALASEQSLEDLTFKANGRFVRLVDVAAVSRQAADPPTAAVRVNGKPVIALAISMSEGGNLLDFGRAVKTKIAEIASKLPQGIEVTQVADQSAVVSDAVFGFLKVLAEAIVIVLAVSFVSLGSRAGLVITASIPLVLALTFTGMEATGIGLQRISLGALIISLGLLVDDAMITVETMVACLERGIPLDRAASHAYETTAFPMLTGTLVMIAGFIPVGFAASSAGEYTFSLFMVVLISLTASWVVAVLFSPLIGTWLLPSKLKGHSHGEGRVMRTYRQVLEKSLARRWFTFGVSILALAAAVFGATQLEEQFFPASDRPELLVSLTLPQNASRESTETRARSLEQLLKNDPDVKSFTTYVGAGSVRFYLPMDLLLENDNVSETVVVTKGVAQRDLVRARVEAAFARDFSDITTRVSPLELGPPVGWPIKFRVTGPDYAKVREIASRVSTFLDSHGMTRDVNTTAGEPQRQFLVEINQVEARAIGVSSESVSSTIAATISGSRVTTLRDRDRLIDVFVKGADAERRSIETIANITVRTPDGRSVPLRQIATVTYGFEEPVIWRRQGRSMVIVQADVPKGVQSATISAELNIKLDELRAELPLGYAITAGGVSEEASKGNSSVFAVVPAMLFVIVALLMFQLQSFARTALALAMAPFGLIGVVLAMLPTGTPMGFVSQLGVIALSGMIIRNAVILIEEVDVNVVAGMNGRDAVVAAATHRARPIVLTACAAILGMIPIAVQIFWGPMAYAIIGGLAAATVLTLVLLPCLLLWLLEFEDRRSANYSAASGPVASA